VVHNNEFTIVFCSKSNHYAILLQMYFSYMFAVNDAIEILNLSTLSISSLQKTLLSVKDEEKLLLTKDSGTAEDSIESMIERVSKVTTRHQKRKKGRLDKTKRE
jgi:hypothetical protein